MVDAYIALGSNIGDRLGNLSRAVDAVAHLPMTHVNEVSHAYESEPAYYEEQESFLNAVIQVETGLDSDQMLSYLLGIEDEMGRERRHENSPRIIDLDLLLFSDEEIETDELTLPHPGILERDFVVTPLLEIAPDIELPDGSRPNRENATVGAVIRDYGMLPDAGLDHNMPIEHTDWVAVAQSEGTQSAVGGFDAQLQVKRQVLEQEGIPYAFEPFEPGLDMDILGRYRVFSLVVPAQFADRAEELLGEFDEAEPIEPVDESSL